MLHQKDRLGHEMSSWNVSMDGDQVVANRYHYDLDKLLCQTTSDLGSQWITIVDKYATTH